MTVADKDALARIAEAQPHIPQRVLAAELFFPNARYYGGGLFEVFSKMAERSAIRTGGLARQALWAVSENKLYIFKAKYRILARRVDILGLLGAWKRDELAPRQVPEKGNLRGEPDYAIAFETPDGRRIEMQAATHSPAARRLIEALTGSPPERVPR